MQRRVAILGVALGAVGLISLTTPAATAGPANTVAGTTSSGSSDLHLRARPSNTSDSVGLLPSGTRVTVACYEPGVLIVGRIRTTDRWNRLSNGRYVSDAYIKRASPVSRCPSPTTVPAPSANSAMIVAPSGALAAGTWVAPVPGRAVNSFRSLSRPEHDGIDMMAPRNTPIRAAAAGTVVTVRCNTSGPSCDVDGGTDVRGCGWYVEIKHTGNIITRYCHMVRQPEVTVGQQVVVGQVIGLVGTSGHSSGTHVHFEVHFGAPTANRHNAIDPASFMSQAGAPIT